MHLLVCLLFPLSALAFATSQPAPEVDDDAVTVIAGCRIEPDSQCPDANLRNQDLTRMNLSGANLSGADLQEVKLAEANLEDADLRGSRQRFGNFQGSNMAGCKGCPGGWD